MAVSDRQEPVFDLIRNMSKAEKRNFKLYATRLSGNQDAKFLTLFDYLDSADEYDEAKILARCPVKKEQLPNMKAHLYRQILTSIRLLNVNHSEVMQLREQLDFARILYDKGLYRQSAKILDKAGEQSTQLEQHGIALEIVELQEKIGTLTAQKDMIQLSDAACRQVHSICNTAGAVSELSNTSMRMFSLYNTLGYARTQKDLDLIVHYFKPRLEAYSQKGEKMSFHERFYLYQASAWYYYIQHNFVQSFRNSRKWVELFDANPRMKRVKYDDYLRGYSQILEGLYLMRKDRQFGEALERFRRESGEIGSLNNNAYILFHRILYTQTIHYHFMRGEFVEGLAIVPEIDAFIEKHRTHIGLHNRMLMYYKIACLYFGAGEYRKCMSFLGRITSTKDPMIRRDLQCFARILNLISSYEAGIDYNLDYQIRSVYAFLVKMNDMNAVQKEMMTFLKKLNSIYADDIKEELRILHGKLLPYENHPYERRTFYYLDLMSWLESRIKGQNVAEIIRGKYENRKGRKV